MIFTHAGKLGDFLLCLPVASYYYKTTGDKVHFVLPKGIPHIQKAISLLEYQDFTEKVSLIDFKIHNFNCGGQPWNINPADFGIEGEYKNFGYFSLPGKYVPEYYAQNTSLGVDYEYRIQYPKRETPELVGKILCFNDYGILDDMYDLKDQKYHIASMDDDILTNLIKLNNAEKSISGYSASVILCDWSNIKDHTAYVKKEIDYRIRDTFIKNLKNIIFIK